MNNKEFILDFIKFQGKLLKHEPFSLGRFGDGELEIIRDNYINLTNHQNGEFVYDPNDTHHRIYRNYLIDALQYKEYNYYVGIICGCCAGRNHHEYLKELSGQDDEHLTWANIFEKSNYKHFLSKMLPLFNEYEVTLVVNRKSDISQLPFLDSIREVYYVGKNAWMSDLGIMDCVKNYAIKNNNKLFLFASGPLSNLLVFELNKLNSQNTYLDIGATLDVILGLGRTRLFLGENNLNSEAKCIW